MMAISRIRRAMQDRNAIWVALLRMNNGSIAAECVMTLVEMADIARSLELRMRFNPDIRLVTMRLPPGTSRQQVFDALDLLSHDERYKLYNLPQHPMVG